MSGMDLPGNIAVGRGGRCTLRGEAVAHILFVLLHGGEGGVRQTHNHGVGEGRSAEVNRLSPSVRAPCSVGTVRQDRHAGQRVRTRAVGEDRASQAGRAPAVKDAVQVGALALRFSGWRACDTWSCAGLRREERDRRERRRDSSALYINGRPLYDARCVARPQPRPCPRRR